MDEPVSPGWVRNDIWYEWKPAGGFYEALLYAQVVGPSYTLWVGYVQFCARYPDTPVSMMFESRSIKEASLALAVAKVYETVRAWATWRMPAAPPECAVLQRTEGDEDA